MKTDSKYQADKNFLRKIKKQKGFWRSRIIYDSIPFRRRRLYIFYRQFIRHGDLCFDLGAHTGNHTLALLRIGARVIVVEPHPVFADHIRKRFLRFKEKTVLQKAIAEKEGKQLFRIANNNPTLSTLSESWMEVIRDYGDNLQWDEELEVEVTTLDRLIKNYGIPAFCKIDVEGYEEKVLAGLSTPLPALSFEFFPTTPHRTVQCIDRLSHLGDYKYNWSFRETYKFLSPDWMSSDEMVSHVCNYIGRKSGDIYAFHKDILQ